MKIQLTQTLLLAFLAAGTSAYAQVDTSARPTSAGTAPTTMGSTSVTRPTGATSKATDKSLIDNLAGASDFSTLQAALMASGLADQAKGPGPYTVFAPSNAAFSKLPAGALQSLTQPANKSKLAGILAYHVVPGNITASDLKDGQTLRTVGGGKLTVRKESNVVMLTDEKGGSAMVTTADIQATNGTIHAIDSVLMPK